MSKIMDLYAEARASRKQPPYDESLAADRQRFEDFKAGFVQGIGEALRQVRETTDTETRGHGRN